MGEEDEEEWECEEESLEGLGDDERKRPVMLRRADLPLVDGTVRLIPLDLEPEEPCRASHSFRNVWYSYF